jgi:hypothetical protein
MEKFVFKYESEYSGNIQMEFDGDQNIDDVMEKFKRFLLACGFNHSLVEEYKDMDEDNTILRDRIVSAIEALDLNSVEDAKKYLNNALM